MTATATSAKKAKKAKKAYKKMTRKAGKKNKQSQPKSNTKSSHRKKDGKKITHKKLSQILPTAEDPIQLKKAFHFVATKTKKSSTIISNDSGDDDSMLNYDPTSINGESDGTIATTTTGDDDDPVESQFVNEVSEAWAIAASLSPSLTSPYLCCHDDDDGNTKNTGYDRLLSLVSRLNLQIHESANRDDDDDDDEEEDDEDEEEAPLGYPVFNNENQSCVVLPLTMTDAEGLMASNNDNTASTMVTVIPFTLSMKIDGGTIDAIDSWFGKGNGTAGDDAKSWFSEKNDINGKWSQRRRRHRHLNGDGGNIFKEWDGPMEYAVTLAPMVVSNGTTTAEAQQYEIQAVARRVVEKARGVLERFFIGSDVDDGGDGRRLRGGRQREGLSYGGGGSILSVLHYYDKEFNGQRGSTKNSTSHSRLLQDNDERINTTLYKDIFQNVSFQVYPQGNSFTIRFPSYSQNQQDTLLLGLSAMVYQSEVLSVSALAPITTFNLDMNYIVQGGEDGRHEEPFHYANFTGKGQVVALSDTGLDVNNCYFNDPSGNVPLDGSIDLTRRKVIQYIPFGPEPNFKKDDYGGHGTHVAGILGGSGGRFGGIAPDAKLSFFDVSQRGKSLSVPNVPGLFEPGRNAGAKIHNFSWGCGLRSCLNRYADMSHNFDDYLYKNQHLTAVVASGNAGEDGGVSWPGTAKNVITVGSTVNHKQYRGFVPAFSGRGFCNGRPCVDLLAPGDILISSMAGTMCDTMEKFGTSMSAPVISGTVALIRQYFEQVKPDGIDQPSGPLIKAVLLNGGQECSTGQVYDEIQGYGRVSLKNTVPLEGLNSFEAAFYDRKFIRNRQTARYEFRIRNNRLCKQQPLRVTLAWYDPPAPTVLNDLDLLATHAGKQYYPNGKQNKDSVNNVERIQIDNPLNGQDIIITVNAANLITSQARYSMVVTGCISMPMSLSASRDVLNLSDDALY